MTTEILCACTTACAKDAEIKLLRGLLLEARSVFDVIRAEPNVPTRAINAMADVPDRILAALTTSQRAEK